MPCLLIRSRTLAAIMTYAVSLTATAADQPPPLPPIVHKGAGKTLPAAQLALPKRTLPPGIRFLTWPEKLKVLRTLNVAPTSDNAPGGTINLTVHKPLQTLNGKMFWLSYNGASYVYPSYIHPFGDSDNGVAVFKNDPTMYNGYSADGHSSLVVSFMPKPNKRYLFEFPLAPAVLSTTFYVYLTTGDGSLQQVVDAKDRILVLFPGTSISGDYIFAMVIRADNHRGPNAAWDFSTCQITEI